MTALASNTLLSTLVAAALVACALLVVVAAAAARHKKSAAGELSIVGRLASVEEPLEPEGSVIVDGELWRARLSDDLTEGGVGRGRANVRVTGARGHLLLVERLDRGAVSPVPSLRRGRLL